MAVEEQIVREAPEVEKRRIGLLDSAKALADQALSLPAYQVAERNALLQQAESLAQGSGGIGDYQNYLTNAAATMGAAPGLVTQGLQGSLQGVQQAGADITGASQAGVAGLEAAQAGLLPQAQGFIDQMGQYQAGLPGETAAYQQDLARAGLGLPQETAAYQGLLGAAGQGLAGEISGYQDQIGRAAEAIGSESQPYLQDLRGAGAGLPQETAGFQQRIGAASGQIPGAVSQGQGIMGSGIDALGTAAQQYDPSAVQSYFSPYEDAAVQQALADIQRAGDIQENQLRAQAVGAGAFGGSRQAIAERELDRNVLEQQARTAAQMRQAGFADAAQRAQAAFEASKGRQLQQASQFGALGQGIGNLGLQGAAQQAQLEALGAQTGLASRGVMADLANRGLQGVLAARTSQAQLAGQQAQTGLAGRQTEADLATRGAQVGLAGRQAEAGLAAQGAQLGQAGRQLGASIAGQGAQTGLAARQGLGSLAAQQAQTGMAGGSEAARLAALQQQLGLQTADALGQTGVRQASLAELAGKLGTNDINTLVSLGQLGQSYSQAVADAQRQTELQNIMEPYQRVGFQSDIYKGAPTSQMTLTSSTSPQVSPFQQALGTGIAGLSAAAGASKIGLF